MQTSKHILAGVGIAAIATALVSFSGERTTKKEDEKKKKYHVLHQKDGEMVEYDTIIPMSSNYSVQDFLNDKGIDDENVKIIEIPSAANMKMMSTDGEGVNVFMHKMDEDVTIEDNNGERTEVKIIREENDKGEVTMKKFVNGEEVELTEEDMQRMQHRGDGEQHQIILKNGNKDLIWVEKEGAENVELKVEVDEEGNTKVQKFVNGKEVEVTEEELEMIESKENGMQHRVVIMEDGDDMHWTPKEGSENVEIKVEVDDEGNMQVQKFVNGEEVEVSEEELERIQNGNDNQFMVIHAGEDGEINMDSILMDMEMKIDFVEMEGMEEGQQRIIVKEIRIDEEELDGEKKEIRKEIRMENRVEVNGDEEDFTVVLVHENYDPSMEAQTEVHMMIEEENDAISNEREMAMNEPISVYPNPNNGTFTIAFNQKNEAKTSIQVVDTQGKVVYKEKLGAFSGSYKKELDLKKHGVGVYVVTVQQGGETSSRKVIVE